MPRPKVVSDDTREKNRQREKARRTAMKQRITEQEAADNTVKERLRKREQRNRKKLAEAEAELSSNSDDGDELEAPPSTSGATAVHPMVLRSKKKGSIEQTVNDLASELGEGAVRSIMSSIVKNCNIFGSDIGGCQEVKEVLVHAAIMPLVNPALYTGTRSPPTGILLFGPPGTGKTMIGKWIASQSGATFFDVKASSIKSKWCGEGEKMVNALFTIARARKPSVLFLDEVDNLLCKRTEDSSASRGVLTEFLAQLEGVSTGANQILLLGATNRPHDLDEAARWRFTKRLYVPLPDAEDRAEILLNLMKNEKHTLNEDGFNEISNLLEGYSGADLKNICNTVAMEPLQHIGVEKLKKLKPKDLRPVTKEDFVKVIAMVSPNVSREDILQNEEFNLQYGSLKN